LDIDDGEGFTTPVLLRINNFANISRYKKYLCVKVFIHSLFLINALETNWLPLGLAIQNSGLLEYLQKILFASSYVSLSQGAATKQILN